MVPFASASAVAFSRDSAGLLPVLDYAHRQHHAIVQALENRDGFSKSQWPGMDDAYWTRMGGKQAGAGSSPQSGKMNLIRSSELIGKEVQDRSGKNVGEVQDVIVGLQNGEVKNIVVSVRDGGRAMVPAKSIKASGTNDRLVLDMSAEKLKSK